MLKEVKRVQQEREVQSKLYKNRISSKDETIKKMQSVNDMLKQQVLQMRNNLKVEELEKQIDCLLDKNQQEFDLKDEVCRDLEAASKYVTELESKTHQQN